MCNRTSACGQCGDGVCTPPTPYHPVKKCDMCDKESSNDICEDCFEYCVDTAKAYQDHEDDVCQIDCVHCKPRG